MLDLGTVRPGTTLYIPFHTFDSNDPSASVTLTGLATTDIEIYKDGSATQRASDSGYALLDTDGIDFDSTTGIHGFSVDLSDNTTAGFYAAGHQYWVVVASITVDAATINFVAATFRIGYENAILNTTINAYTSTDNFTLNEGSADDDAYNGCILLAHDVASAIQVQLGVIEDYTGSTKTVNLKADPGVFTMAANDNISILPPALLSTTMGNTLDVAATGEAGVDLGNATGTLTQANVGWVDANSRVDVGAVLGTAQTAGDIMGSLGEENASAAAGDPSTTESVMQYVKQIINVLVGTTGVTTYPAEAAPANNVSLAEVIRAIHADVTGLNGDAMRGTDNAALASVLGVLNDAAAAGDPTNSDTAMQYLKQVLNVLIGTSGIATYPSAAAPGNAVSLAEVLRAIYDDTNNIDGTGVNVTSISGDSGAADNLEADYDGTGYAKTNSTVGTVTDVTNQVTADATAISGSTEAADNLEASAETIVIGTAQTGTLSTTQMTTNLTEATDDHYNGRTIIWTSGALQDQATDITDYDGTNKLLTFTAVTEAPANGDTFTII